MFDQHETAVIDPGAQIGDGSRIWHFVHVCGGARIGQDCSLGQNVFVGNQVVIGNNVKIQNNVSIYDGVTLEDDVFCGPSMVFTNVYNPRSAVSRKDEYRDTVVRRGAPPRRAGMGPHDRTIAHQRGPPGIVAKKGEHLFPNPVPPPALKPAIHRVPAPWFGGEEPPRRTASQDPKDGLNKPAAIGLFTEMNPFLLLEEAEDFLPCFISQLDI